MVINAYSRSNLSPATSTSIPSGQILSTACWGLRCRGSTIAFCARRRPRPVSIAVASQLSTFVAGAGWTTMWWTSPAPLWAVW